ncbi:MAG TPA: histidine kinase [Rhodanobacteraceae bacterium]
MRDTQAMQPDSADKRSRTLDLPNRTLLLVACLFWLYVTASNVLYAENIQVEVGKLTGATVFGPWQQRVLQHVFLFPLLLACYWAALRIGWASAPRTALQIALGAAFAAVSFWAMVAAILLPDLFAPVATRMTSEHPESVAALWFASFVNFLLNYAFGLALVTGLAVYRRFHATELRVVTLEREWSTARLTLLRLQLSPHTLFNLLHTIRGQIAWEPGVAQAMMVQFADLLRRSLNASERDFSPLADELEFARLYLELQHGRFGDRLAFSLPANPSSQALWVPSLILQPLIENAVAHGIDGGATEVRVEVEVFEQNVVLRVTNTIAPDRPRGRDGIGLRNVRERLAVHFGERARLEAGAIDRTTWQATITLPALREHARVAEVGAP